MKKLLLVLVLYSAFVNAQIINFPDTNLKNALVSDMFINTDGDNEIEVSEALAVDYLNLSNQNITSIEGLQYFTNITVLNLASNSLVTVDLSPFAKLWQFNVSGNDLTSLAIYNPLLEVFECSNNPIINLNINSCPLLRVLNVDGCPIQNPDFSNLTHLDFLDLLGQNVSGTLNLSGCTALGFINLSAPNISALNVSGCTALGVLSDSSGSLTSVNLSGCSALTIFRSFSMLTEIDFSENLLLKEIELQYTPTTLDVSNQHFLEQLTVHSNNLQTLYMKNGSHNISNVQLQTPNLKFVCADPWNNAAVLDIANWVNESIVVNSYCSFTPGGDFNTITGKIRFDENNNGCDENDSGQEFLKVKTDDGTNQGFTFTDSNSQYKLYTNAGNFTLTPQFENPLYFIASPVTATVNFPDSGNLMAIQNFCFVANASTVHPDVEVVFAPINAARPGFDSVYKIVYKNKGNTTLSGNVVLNFDDNVLDLVESAPVENAISTGTLSYNYSALRPFESRTIIVTFSVNTPTETPPVNIDDQLVFSATINPIANDETPEDNTFSFIQTVVGSFDPNDKLCLEGAVVSPTQIGKYLHYMINFENTGTHIAENVVVKDVINTAMFDINSLQVLNTSANAQIKVTGNAVEFIFEGIHLPIGGHGNVLFKIKTRDDLNPGTEVQNTADIFFDYNTPIVTLPAKTRFHTLATADFDADHSINIYPNPANHFVNIEAKSKIKSIQMYDIQGRLLEILHPEKEKTGIDISTKANGVYFVKITSENGISTKKIMKE